MLDQETLAEEQADENMENLADESDDKLDLGAEEMEVRQPDQTEGMDTQDYDTRSEAGSSEGMSSFSETGSGDILFVHLIVSCVIKLL